MAEHEDALTPPLREATELLRELPEPRSEWRDEVLRGIAAARQPTRTKGVRAFLAGRWAMRPVTALAAGLACALIGGAAATLMLRESGQQQAATIATAAPATPVMPTTLVRFTLVAPQASRVSIVGDFNQWDPTALPLRRAADGQSWEVEIPLVPGRYAYSFVVDGMLARDPGAPQVADDDFGKPNSIVMVKGS